MATADIEDQLLDPFHQVVARDAQANPLLYAGTGWGPLGRPAPQQTTEVGEGNVPNPLVTPPVPIQEMPLAQQVAWHTLLTKENADANANQDALLTIKSNKDKQEKIAKAQTDFEAIRVRAKNELDPSQDDYPLVKNRIIADHAYGTLDPRFAGAFADTDAVFQKRQELQKENQQHERNLTDTRMTEQIQAGRQLANSAGPEYAAQFEAKVASDPAGAIAFAADAAGKYKIMNTVADLKALGYDDAKIQKEFTSPDGNFLFGTADRRVKELSKARESADVEEKRALDIYNSQLNEKNAAMKLDSDPITATRIENWNKAKAIDADPNLDQEAKAKKKLELDPNGVGMTPPRWGDDKEQTLQYYQRVAMLHGMRHAAEAEAEAKKAGLTLSWDCSCFCSRYSSCSSGCNSGRGSWCNSSSGSSSSSWPASGSSSWPTACVHATQAGRKKRAGRLGEGGRNCQGSYRRYCVYRRRRNSEPHRAHVR